MGNPPPKHIISIRIKTNTLLMRPSRRSIIVFSASARLKKAYASVAQHYHIEADAQDDVATASRRFGVTV
jgi:hypothetical protein